MEAPPAPFCDCYVAQHSAEAGWTTPASVDAVREALSQAISSTPADRDGGRIPLREPTPFEEREYFGRAAALSSSVSAAVSSDRRNYESVDGRADVKAIRVSPSAGFRDFVVFHISPLTDDGGGPADSTGAHGARVVGRGRSLDYHVWTACICCRGIAWCKYVACLFCCCGVCPTKDWGQNMQTLEDIVAATDVGLKRTKDPRDALNHKPPMYEPPGAVEASRTD